MELTNMLLADFTTVEVPKPFADMVYGRSYLPVLKPVTLIVLGEVHAYSAFVDGGTYSYEKEELAGYFGSGYSLSEAATDLMIRMSEPLCNLLDRRGFKNYKASVHPDMASSMEAHRSEGVAKYLHILVSQEDKRSLWSMYLDCAQVGPDGCLLPEKLSDADTPQGKVALSMAMMGCTVDQAMVLLQEHPWALRYMRPYVKSQLDVQMLAECGVAL